MFKVDYRCISCTNAIAKKRALCFLGWALALLTLVSCSSGPSLPKPLPLSEFPAQVKITTHWQRSVGAGVKVQDYAQVFNIVASDGLLFTAAKGGQISAVNAATGVVQWQVDIRSSIVAGLGQAPNGLLVSTEDGSLYLLSMQDGSIIWRVVIASESLSVAQANDEFVFIQTIDGRLGAYDVKDGSLLWSYISDVPNLTLRGTSSPAIEGKAVYAGFANGKLIALDTHKGDELWQRRIGISVGRSEVQRLVDIDAPLLLVDSVLYVSDYHGHISALDTMSGKRLWQSPFFSLVQPTVVGDAVVVVTEKSSLVALNRNNGEVLWNNDNYLHRGLSQVHVLDSWLIAADTQGFIHILDQDTGTTIGRTKGRHMGAANSLITIGARAYLLGQNALLSSFSIQ